MSEGGWLTFCLVSVTEQIDFAIESPALPAHLNDPKYLNLYGPK